MQNLVRWQIFSFSKLCLIKLYLSLEQIIHAIVRLLRWTTLSKSPYLNWYYIQFYHTWSFLNPNPFIHPFALQFTIWRVVSEFPLLFNNFAALLSPCLSCVLHTGGWPLYIVPFPLLASFLMLERFPPSAGEFGEIIQANESTKRLREFVTWKNIKFL